jgi:hypothetical protein
MKIEEIKKLIDEVEKLKADDPENVIYIDALELLKMSYLFLEKFENSKPKYEHISFSGDDWKQNNIPFGRLKNFLKNLEYNGVIEHLIFALGGNGFFNIIDKSGFINAVQEEVDSVKENLRKSNIESKKVVAEEVRTEIVDALKEFRSFVEKDGFLAFWDNNKVGGDLKNHPEEIGKSQLMAFLTGRGTGYIAREVPVGKGFQDIIFVEDPKSPIIIETKILTSNNGKYEEGKFQLKDYVKINNHNEGYYLIFETDKFYNEDSFVEDGINIHQIVINIAPKAPTKKFREKSRGD